MPSAAIDPKRWYTARDASAFLDIIEQTVCQYCRDNEFGRDARKMGPRKRWHVKGSAIISKRKEWHLDDLEPR